MMEDDRLTEQAPREIINTELEILIGSLRRILGGVGSLRPDVMLNFTTITGRLAEDIAQLQTASSVLGPAEESEPPAVMVLAEEPGTGLVDITKTVAAVSEPAEGLGAEDVADSPPQPPDSEQVGLSASADTTSTAEVFNLEMPDRAILRLPDEKLEAWNSAGLQKSKRMLITRDNNFLINGKNYTYDFQGSQKTSKPVVLLNWVLYESIINKRAVTIEQIVAAAQDPDIDADAYINIATRLTSHYGLFESKEIDGQVYYQLNPTVAVDDLRKETAAVDAVAYASPPAAEAISPLAVAPPADDLVKTGNSMPSPDSTPEAEPQAVRELTKLGLTVDQEANFYIKGQLVAFQESESPAALVVLLKLMIEETKSTPAAKNIKIGLPNWNDSLNLVLGRAVDPDTFSTIKEDIENAFKNYEGYKPTFILSSSTIGVHMSGIVVEDADVLDPFLLAAINKLSPTTVPPSEGISEPTLPISWQLKIIEIEGRPRYCVLDSDHPLRLDAPAEAIMAALIQKVDVGLTRDDLLAQVLPNGKCLQPEAYDSGMKQIRDALRSFGLDNRLRIEIGEKFSNPTIKILSGMPEEPPDFLDQTR